MIDLYPLIILVKPLPFNFLTIAYMPDPLRILEARGDFDGPP